jgi:RHS repeat-associated protein
MGSYDDMGRVTGVARGVVSATLGYEASYEYNACHELQSVTGLGKDASYTYDLDGNRLTETKGGVRHRYGYTFENRLEKVWRGPEGSDVQIRGYTFQGDSWMRRTAVETDGGNTVTTNFLYDGDNAVAEFDGSYNLTAHHVTNGLDRTLWSVRGTAFQAPLSSAQNVMAVADAAGVVTARYRYRAFGERVTLSGGAPNRTDPSFQNRSFDAGLGIYDYRNRQFDPATGRFLRKSRWG